MTISIRQINMKFAELILTDNGGMSIIKISKRQMIYEFAVLVNWR